MINNLGMIDNNLKNIGYNTAISRLVCMVCIVLSVVSHAQPIANDTVRQLPVIEINARKTNLNIIGIKTFKVDSAVLTNYSNSTLSDILSEQTPVIVRSYSKSGLANVMIRGLNVIHTGIFWNGININTPNIGMTDLSLVASDMFNSMEIQKGGAAATLGNGIIGGSIHLNNNHSFTVNKAANISFNSGSYGLFSGSANVTASNSHYSSITYVSMNTANNNFDYIDRANIVRSIKKLENAASKSVCFMNETAWKIDNKNIITAGFWGNQSFKYLPVIITMANKNETQDDKNLRTFIKWQHTRSRFYLNISTALFDDRLYYNNPTDRIYSDIHTISFNMLNSNFNYNLNKNINISGGTNSVNNTAYIDFYKARQTEMRTDCFAGITYNNKKADLTIALLIRQAFIENYNVPFTPSLGAELKIYKNISAKINISKNYRVPTMNEKFWVPGGNKNLIPETSFNSEATIVYATKNTKNLNIDILATIYRSSVDNWIAWIANENSVPTAVNYQKVLSRGVEAETRMNWKVNNNYKISLSGGYNITNADRINNLNTIGNKIYTQLMYVPLSNSFFTAILFYKQTNLSVNYLFVGRRFINEEESKYLIPYHITNLSLSQTFSIKNNSFKIRLNINNIFNQDYYVLNWQPMPGINYVIALNMIIK